MPRVKAEIENLFNGLVVQEVNLGLAQAGLRLKETGRAQTVVVQIKLAKSQYAGIVDVAHKVVVREATPKDERCFAFIDDDTGEVTVDLDMDQGDPELRQRVINFPNAEER